MIYLDNGATTYPKPECVYKALDKANRNAFNTGRGSYKVAREATKVIDEVRNKIMAINGIANANVIFTSSATSALNNLIFGIDILEGDNIYISPFVHNSVIRPLEELRVKKNINVITIPFLKDTWDVDIDKLKNMFALKKPKAIIISHISNVTGLILPYEIIFEESAKYKAINILDSSQGYGIVKIENLNNINYIVFAGHKSLYGSFGIAGYIKLKQDKLKKTIFGGTGSDTMNPKMLDKYPDGYEAGSPNIVGISNLYLPDNLEKIFGIVSFNIDGYKSLEVGNILDDEFDICVRTGFHCAPLIHDFLSSLDYGGTVRISLGYFNTKKDIDDLINALKTL